MDSAEEAPWMRSPGGRRRRRVVGKRLKIDPNPRDYFNSEISPQNVLLRLPDGYPADVLSVVNRALFELRGPRLIQADGHRLALSRELLVRAASCVHTARFESIGDCAEEKYSVLPMYSVLVMFAFVLAFLGNDGGSVEEMHFIQQLESLDICEGDVPHFTHLVEELTAVGSPAGVRLPAMLRMFGLHEMNIRMVMRDNFQQMSKVVPVFRAKPGFAVSKAVIERTLQNLSKTAAARFSVVSEGCEVESWSLLPLSDVLKLVDDKKWQELMGTQMLDIEAPLSLMHQALALFKMKKYSDLVDYCTKCYSVSKSNVFLYIRAAAWLMLGMRDLSQNDMELAAGNSDDNQIQQNFGESILKLAK